MKIILTFISIILYTSVLSAQDKVIDLWPNGAPSDNGLSGPEIDEGNNCISNISVAKMYIYLPKKEINTGVAVVFCPGGGYRKEMMSYEGLEIGEWLKSKGITGIILKYRLPNGHPNIPLEDASRAIRVTRQYAGEWGINPDKIGIGGASAGGHLASTTGTRFDLGNANSDDPVEVFSSRPDFMLLLYPLIHFRIENAPENFMEIFFGKDPDQETIKQYCSDLNVSADTPSAFLVLADNDEFPILPKQSIEFYLSMRNFNIPAEMHVFHEGGHGFGITKHDLPVDQWPNLFFDWLKTIKMVK